MGSWDCYCAICAGPIGRARIAKRSRRAETGEENIPTLEMPDTLIELPAEYERWLDDSDHSDDWDEDEEDDQEMTDIEDENENEVEPEGEGGGEGEAQVTEEGVITSAVSVDNEVEDRGEGEKKKEEQKEEEEDEQDEQGEEDEDEDRFGDDFDGYDPAVLRRRDKAWATMCHVLGFNSKAPGTSKAFVTGPGVSQEYGGIDVQLGSDPNAQDLDTGDFHCYWHWEKGDPVFPFHWPCYELLVLVLTGARDPSAINKDVLYSVMRSISPPLGSVLGLCYSEPDADPKIDPELEQYWESRPGQELLLASPARSEGLRYVVLDDLSRRDFNLLPATDPGLARKSQGDCFARLPWEIVYYILGFISDDSLFKLLQASHFIHSSLHRDATFWKSRISTKLPWFFELHHFLQNDPSASTKDMKGLYLWARHVTKPRFGMTGPYMAIANRRRIWGACQQLADLYWPNLPPPSAAPRPTDLSIRTRTSNPHMSVVSCPIVGREDLRNAFWLLSWEENRHEKLVEAFWDADGYLVGMSVAPKGSPRRLFGLDDSVEGVIVGSVDLDKSVWIAGIDLHIPPLDLSNVSWARRLNSPDDPFVEPSTSPKGVTIHMSDGLAVWLGDVNRDYCIRPLWPAEGHSVVGVNGTIGSIKGKERILRLGILQAPQIGVASTPDKAEPPLQRRCLWREDFYYHAEGLRMVPVGETETTNSDFHLDLLPYHTFRWSQDERDLKRLKRLTAQFIPAGTVSRPGSDFSFEITHGLCNMRAEYDVLPHDARPVARHADIDGTPFPETDLRHFNIDGPGGERVIAVSAVMSDRVVMGLSLETNFGRKVMWQTEEDVGSDWQRVTHGEGEYIAGLALCFGKVCGYDLEPKKSYKNTELSAVAVLMLPCHSGTGTAQFRESSVGGSP
ncbi:hypothetical protein SODALDRAFT_326552 [Sodiomyces alkalinus F11]|uniref:F-box domain-containing protein n=1 Tax=Sodiomyces alkalinus (strain CBS 110278 / VKM F-3762 / F11) TaxID=1314773 RepID=A0A3N2Q6H4_SODAK|nr:hypothetical protein SODALDRAFT_326552 [Sodiomyces alkalinus F11]ROT42389.1 hypothetical protein SODALDRAFT_326552 [Sodiomyces alkalinus F11]